MSARRQTGLAMGVIVLLAAGLVLLLLGRQMEVPADETPSPPPTGVASAAPSPSPSPQPSPFAGPFLYTVQPGDTLVGIAAEFGVSLEELIAANGVSDPDMLSVGEVLVIPGRTAAVTVPADLPTPAPATPLPTPTSTGPPLVEIAGVDRAGTLVTEAVRVRNSGGAAALEGWTLSDLSGNRFTFPRLILFPGGEVAVHSAGGTDSPTHLYWGRSTPAWERGELITLRDQEGTVVDTYIVP